MSSVAALQTESTSIVACTISRDVSNFDLLIEDMEGELGENWGDLSFADAQAFLDQSEAEALEFIAVAVDGEDENDLGRISAIIAKAKQSGIRVILIADEVSPMALHQLLKLGADSFVPYPLPENALHEAIEQIRSAPPPGYNDPTAPAAGFRSKGDRDGVILPVHGLAGGVGATTLAVNLAWELATVQKDNPPRVCLLDFNFQFGSVSTYLDLPRRESVFEMLSNTANMDGDSFLQAMQVCNERLHVLTSPADMLPLDIVTPEDVSRVLQVARSNFDFVVIDLPCTIVAWSETVLSQSHIYFALMELDMRSAQNALRMIRALKAEDLPYEKMRFALNRAPKFTDLTGKGRAKRLAESLDITLELQLPDGSAQVTQSNDHGLPLAQTAPKNPLRKEIAKLAKQIFDLNKATEAAKA
jgi:pilus assembly protein CpaE